MEQVGSQKKWDTTEEQTELLGFFFKEDQKSGLSLGFSLLTKYTRKMEVL